MIHEVTIRFNTDDASGCTISSTTGMTEKLMLAYMLASTASLASTLSPSVGAHVDAAVDEFERLIEKEGGNHGG